MEILNAVFAWLLRTSWQASVLVGLVLLAQWLFSKKLSPGWRYALWMLPHLADRFFRRVLRCARSDFRQGFGETGEGSQHGKPERTSCLVSGRPFPRIRYKAKCGC